MVHAPPEISKRYGNIPHVSTEANNGPGDASRRAPDYSLTDGESDGLDHANAADLLVAFVHGREDGFFEYYCIASAAVRTAVAWALRATVA